ncbi:centrosomal P4.1-associated protein [Gastrophryne carolinensis]
MPDMISSPEFGGEPDFMAQYMSTIARAGVIVNPAFPNLEQDGGLPRRPSSGLSGLRAPTPLAASSSLLSEDSLEQPNAGYRQPELRPDMKGSMLAGEGSRSRPQSRAMFREDEVLREELNDPLMRKLEQLKEMQQQKQEQLKQWQMEQLQKLMEEQKILINMSRQPLYSEQDQQSRQSGHLGGSTSQRNIARLMSPVSIPRDYLHRRHEMGMREGRSSRPSSVLAQECSPEKSKTLEDLLKEEVAEDYSDDEGDTEESVHDDSTNEWSKKNNGDVEDRPITSVIKERKKSFEEFLEEQMRIEERRLQQTDTKQNTEGQATDKPVTKRPFLRRGEGLARFKSGNKKNLEPQENKTETQKLLETAVPSLAEKTSVPAKAEKVQVHRKTTILPKEQESEKKYGATKASQTLKAKTELIQNKPKINTKNSTSWQQDDKSTSSGRSSVTLERNISLETDKENVDRMKTSESQNRQDSQYKETNKTNDSPQMRDSNPNSAKPGELSFEVSFQKRKVVWEKEKQKENYELNEFLLLEQAAEDISFSSNSSFVQKLLDQDYVLDNGQRRLSSTPVKSVERQMERVISGTRSSGSGRPNDKIDLGLTKKLTDPSAASSSVPYVPVGMNTNEFPQAYKDEARNSPKSSESEGDYASSGDEHGNSALSENEDVDSEVSSGEDENKSKLKGPAKKLIKQTKVKDTDLYLSDGENQDNDDTLLANKSQVSQKDEDQSSSSSESLDCFDDERTWDDLGNLPSLKGVYESNFSSKEFVPSEYTSKSPPDAPDKVITRKVASKKGDLITDAATSADEPCPASDLMLKLFPALKPKAKPESQAGPKSAQVHEGSGDSARSQLLKEKLVELETEIERFKMENASLARLREDKEKTMQALRKEVCDFEEQKVKELARIEEYKKEEIRKLQKERKVFEKYASAARAIPDKKEREEIQNLKQQIKALQEELKKKETKWSTNHVRLRNQIETLTKENAELREEIKFMEKLRLDTWKKTEAAESKKKTSDGPTTLVKRSESMSPLHMLKQRRISAPTPEPEKMVKVLRSQSPVKGLSSRSFKQTSLGDSSNSEPTRLRIAEPAANTTSQVTDKMAYTDTKSESFPIKSGEDIQGEVTYPDGKTERILKNGCHVILFPNGTRKEVTADGKSTTVTFFNGDVKQVMADQRVIYYYADAQTTHTTYPDGLEILQFSNGQIEKHFPDGKKEITFPDQTIKNLYPDGKEESLFPDGTIITSHPDGTKVIEFDNGQRELHTPQFKRREYPDGTVKTVYTNGQQETKYASGRIRVKDKDGNVIMDTKI